MEGLRFVDPELGSRRDILARFTWMPCCFHLRERVYVTIDDVTIDDVTIDDVTIDDVT